MLNRNHQNYSRILIFLLVIWEAVAYLITNNIALNIGVSGIAVFAALLFLDLKNIALVIVFMLPNQRLFVIPGTDQSLINIIVLAAILFNFRGCLKSNHQNTGLFLLIMAYASCVAVIHHDLNLILHAIKPIGVFVLLNCLAQRYSANLKHLYVQLILFLVAGVLATNALGILLDSNYSMGAIGTTQRFSAGEMNNPNIIGFDISFAIALAVVYLSHNRRNLVPTLAACVGLTLFGLMTQSRSFAASLLLILAFFAASSLRTLERKKIQITLAGLITAIAAFFIIQAYLPSIYEPLAYRIFNPRGDDISGNRFTIWGEYVWYLSNNPNSLLLGIGIENIADIVGIDSVAHNAVLETIVIWGTIGSIIFLGLFFAAWKRLKQMAPLSRKKLEPLNYLPFFSLLLSSITGHGFLSNPFIIKYYIAILTIFVYGRYQHHASLRKP